MDLLAEFKELSETVSKIQISLNKSKIRQIENEPTIKHILKYPQITWSDLYKFIMQGTCGWFHLTNQGDLTSVKEWLKRELEDAELPNAKDTLFELIDDETMVGWLNLRKWKNEFGEKIDVLWDLMLKTNNLIPYEIELFKKRWNSLKKWRVEGIFIIQEKDFEIVDKWLIFITELIEQKKEITEIPLVSHSDIFRENYNPSYRLVSKIELEKYLNKNLQI